MTKVMSLAGKKRKQGSDAPPSWVMAPGEDLPKMTAKRSRQYHLPMRTIKQDEEDLRLPKDGELPCRHGAHCTSVVDIQGGPMVPLKAICGSRECLLCHRKGMRAGYVKHTILENTISKNKLVQRFESPVGKDGYREDVCVTRHNKRYNGFISPVAIGTVVDYAWVCDPKTGDWRIDQSPMYQSFCGASRNHPSKSHRGGASKDSCEE